ncbi:MAG: hypothetical protein V3U65_18285 [Granulosicoccaceae bacterium]
MDVLQSWLVLAFATLIIWAVLNGTDRIQKFLSPVLRETLALQSESIHTKTTLLVVTVSAVLILQPSGSF